MSTSSPKELALMATTSMAIYSDTMVLFVVFLTFRRHTGLYFWSLIGTASSQILVCIATYLAYWVLGSRLYGLTLSLQNVGNMMYVVAEFLVLYSRLHILGASRRHLRLILGIIISEWCFIEIPLTILEFYSGLNPEKIWVAELSTKFWRAEAILYVLVDCSLSAMYFFLIKRTWGEEQAWRRVHWNIIGMIVLILCIDVTYLLFVFSDFNEVLLGVAVCSSTSFELFRKANTWIVIDVLPKSSCRNLRPQHVDRHVSKPNSFRST
jgi:hypothetical protein